MWTQRPSRPAFDALRAVSETGLETFDGIAPATVAWSSVMRVTAQIGRQPTDMTRCLLIESDRERSIFLPESEELWIPFLTAMTKRLRDVVPFDVWGPRLLAKQESMVTIYTHPDLPKKYSAYEEAFEWFMQRHPDYRR